MFRVPRSAFHVLRSTIMFSDPSYNIEQLSLQSGAKVADLGCGSGFYSMVLARAVGDKGKVYAIDVQKGLLDRIKKEAEKEELRNIEVIWGDVDDIGGTKLRDDSVDAVVATNLLFQIENKDNFAREIKRILKKGGKLLLVDWSSSFGGVGPEQRAVVSQRAGSELFEKNGFVIERQIRAGDHHWGVIFRRT
jgi:ubiquinone/menaquinone biosynthesis C-methylase UbiE